MSDHFERPSLRSASSSVAMLPAPSSSRESVSAAGGITSLRDLEQMMQSLVASWHESSHVLESRRWHRLPYRQHVLLTRLDEVTLDPRGEPLLVLAQDLSPDGISFIHRQPIHERRVAITLSPGGETVVMRLTWCRFTRQGVYRSGGKFLQKTAPFLETADWDSLPPA